MTTKTKDIKPKFAVGEKVKWGKRKEVFEVHRQNRTDVEIVGKNHGAYIVQDWELTKVPKRAVKKVEVCDKWTYYNNCDPGYEHTKNCESCRKRAENYKAEEMNDTARNIRNWRKEEKKDGCNWYLVMALALGCLLVLAWGTGIERAAGM